MGISIERLTFRGVSHPRTDYKIYKVLLYILLYAQFRTGFHFICICSDYDLEDVNNTPPDDADDEPAMFKRAPWRRRRWRFRVRVRGRRLLKKVCKWVQYTPYESKYYYSSYQKYAVPDWIRNGMAFLQIVPSNCVSNLLS